MRRVAIFCAAIAALVLPANARLVISNYGAPPPASFPALVAIPEIAGLDFPNNGSSPILSGTSLTLAAGAGQWTGSVITRAYNWHTVNAPGTSLGSGSTLTIDVSATPALVGQTIELDETANGLAGSATATSHWFGPIETAAPVAPVAYETISPVPTSIPLPVSPAHFLQCYGPGTFQHAIFPGGDIPPCAPNTTPSNVFYFDPINGTTQAAQTAAGVATASQGHAGHAFKDGDAFFNDTNVPGYSGALFGFGRTIPPGALVLVEPGDATHPVGSFVSGNPHWSTSDGTATGTSVFTWIMGDPAAASLPVIVTDAADHGAIFLVNGDKGFLFKNLRVEPAKTNANEPAISIGSTNNMIFEGIHVSGWIDHSDDPWSPSNYPNSGGRSDGTVVTASPAIPSTGFQDGSPVVVTMAQGATTFSGATAGLVGRYLWSHGYYRDSIDSIVGGASGIPNGTKIISVSGGVATIGPCDPVADAATGCPATNYPGLSSNIPGCDPLVSFRGTNFGGCAGAPPAWSGATRAISGERLQTTEQMLVVPAGYWNNNDWGTGFSTGFVAGGGLNVAGSVNPAAPNLLVGSTYISVKDSWFRDVRNAVQFTSSTNSIDYNNRMKWTSADSIDIYSNHRVWSIHNFASDPTQIWDHQDAIQLADASGTGHQLLYGNAAIENELIQNTDPSNYFPRSWQGINTTDNIWWGTYVADNIVYANTNGIGIGGKFNAVVHNDMFGGALTVGFPHKAPDGLPVHALIANNVANGISRDALNSTPCDPTTGDLSTVETNLSIPFIPLGLAGNSSVYCVIGSSGAVTAGPSPGVYVGLFAWTQTDWRTGQGVSPLFDQYAPLAPPVAPAPGAGLWTQVSNFTCTQLSILPFSCSAGGLGAINLRPNPSFAGTTATILGTFSFIQTLPQTGSIGDAYVVTSTDFCSGQPTSCGPNGTVQPPGVYTRATNSGDYTQWTQAPYNPGIIGAGTNLGAQQPIADHDGKAWDNPPSIGAYAPSSNVAFSPLHTYFMSATGSDAANGLTPATAWATPNHAVVCGDVIVAASGTYTSSFTNWGTVSNCPSTTGGIDGTGGVWMATVLCAGPDVASCKTTSKLWDMNKSNWAVEGWNCTNPGVGSGNRCFEFDGQSGLVHHLAAINNVIFNVASAVHSDDGGHTGAFGVDYFAAVGNIAQNAAQNASFCEAAIDAVGVGVLDSNAGTHVFFDGNFSYSNTATGCASDVEGFMVDTLDQHNVNNQIVISHNIGFNSERECIHVFWQNINPNTPTIKIYNNTCYQDNVSTHQDFAWGEIDTTSTLPGTSTDPWIVSITNNLAYQPLAKSAGAAGGNGWVYAYLVDNIMPSLTITGNFFRANTTTCVSSCNSTKDVVSFAGVTQLNTAGNTYLDPAFTNSTDLFANHLGAPNCTGFRTTTACMGWDAPAAALTTPSVISDLSPTASGTSGKGYQRPSTNCAPNADYPTWLKGIVYLHWNAGSSTITENAGLVTKPCGL